MPAQRELAIPIPHAQIADFCRKWGIRKLSFFGSVVREDFGPESDVDVLVEFKPGAADGWEVIHAQRELSAILSRKVDLVEERLLNRWIRSSVLSDVVTEYVEAE